MGDPVVSGWVPTYMQWFPIMLRTASRVSLALAVLAYAITLAGGFVAGVVAGGGEASARATAHAPPAQLVRWATVAQASGVVVLASSVAAVILGHRALRGGPSPAATAGVILGYLYLALFAATLLVAVLHR